MTVLKQSRVHIQTLWKQKNILDKSIFDSDSRTPSSRGSRYDSRLDNVSLKSQNSISWRIKQLTLKDSKSNDQVQKKMRSLPTSFKSLSLSSSQSKPTSVKIDSVYQVMSTSLKSILLRKMEGTGLKRLKSKMYERSNGRKILAETCLWQAASYKRFQFYHLITIKWHSKFNSCWLNVKIAERIWKMMEVTFVLYLMIRTIKPTVQGVLVGSSTNWTPAFYGS